jgi:hypothetical protein
MECIPAHTKLPDPEDALSNQTSEAFLRSCSARGRPPTIAKRHFSATRQHQHGGIDRMKKLRLDLNDLKVESFVTTPDQGPPQGTVFGQDTRTQSCDSSCTDTCWEHTCGNTCGESCGGTCDTGCGSGHATCDCGLTPNCLTDYTCYHTHCCANDSAPGYASCGTTCGEPSCAQQCPPSLHAPPYC